MSGSPLDGVSGWKMLLLAVILIPYAVIVWIRDGIRHWRRK